MYKERHTCVCRRRGERGGGRGSCIGVAILEQEMHKTAHSFSLTEICANL
jgi:hypothetical protein